MIIEVYDNYKKSVPCVGSIKVHCMSSSCVKLTFGCRLQSVYTCEDCGVSCIKLARRSKDHTKNAWPAFGKFICLQYEENSQAYC